MSPNSNIDYQEIYKNTLNYLANKNRVLFLTTSNRWSGEKGGDRPKSTQLAYKFASELDEGKANVIEVPKLKIYACEGNVSTDRGNTCGLKDAKLGDPSKNPTGEHRCWASLNNADDELWRISKEIFESDCVVFFTSIRWGQANACYQKLIERLTWLENRHSALGESNLLEKVDAGFIAVGQNWRGQEVVDLQKNVLKFYGFNIVDALFWNWQFLDDSEEETDESYIQGIKEFRRIFRIAD